jgi:membrane protease YdiL (CAAX protease family)
MRKQVFLVWFFIFLVWSFYRAYFYFPEWLDEIFIKPLVFTGPIFFLVLYREEKGKEGLRELGLWPNFKDLLMDIYIGVAVGILFAFEGLFANFIKYGTFSLSPIFAFRVVSGLLPFFISNLFTAFWEEILGRGFLFKRLSKSTDNQLDAAFTSSFLFLLLHIPILFTRLHLTGTSLLVYPLSILLLGIVNSFLFAYRGSLVLPILIHTFWNMTVALYM